MPAVAAGSNSSSTSIVRPRRIVSTLEEERYFESEDEDEEGPLKQQLSQVPSSSATLESVNVYEVIPEDYKKHHQDAEPQMHYLKQVDEEESLSTLITAALQDIRLHQARIKASLLNDTTWLQTYSFAYDDAYQERVARREARLAYLNKLQRDATLILRELEDDKKSAADTRRESASQVGAMATGLGIVCVLTKADEFGLAWIAGKAIGRHK